MLMEIRKCMLLEDGASDLFHSWTAASLLDLKGNTTNIFFFSCQPGRFSQMWSRLGGGM